MRLLVLPHSCLDQEVEAHSCLRDEVTMAQRV